MNIIECLISKEPIVNNITLPCKHSYEYVYLYEEIKQQKNRHKTYKIYDHFSLFIRFPLESLLDSAYFNKRDY